MRYIKLSSVVNPDGDYIELNDLGGYFCTQFKTIGINRKYSFLQIQNRQFPVTNNIEFATYNLVIEILSKYADYESKYSALVMFLDRNKNSGFRLYYRPYDNMSTRYCLCEIISSSKTEKMQPVNITLAQTSLWYGETIQEESQESSEQEGNIFQFADEGNGYYCAKYNAEDGYYCISFYNGKKSYISIINQSYNEIPININIYGSCENPTISLYKKDTDELLKKAKILANISDKYYIEINATILDNGVWYRSIDGNQKDNYVDRIQYDDEHGSPYFYVGHGEYYIIVQDGNNICKARINYTEEYSV